jgi:hypothetical protein
VGKTSLLIRGIQDAKTRFGANVVYFDLQAVGDSSLSSLDQFRLSLAYWIVDDLKLDPEIVEKMWSSILPATKKMTKLMARSIFPKIEKPLLLAMDEIDQLQLTDFHTEFFGLIRSWHNLRAHDPAWNALNIIMAISTEPYLLIDNLNQSPFNVGKVIYLTDFDQEQVADLGRRYNVSLTANDMGDLMKLLNGHPYLTRIAFYTMAFEGCGWAEFEAQSTVEHGPFHQHLQLQRRALTQDRTLRQALREIVSSNTCSDVTAGFRLMKAGLVFKEGNRYICRCGLYRRYFADAL